MDIHEIQKRKIELQNIITSLILNFEKETGVEIDQIELEKIDVSTYDKKQREIYVRIRIGL